MTTRRAWWTRGIKAGGDSLREYSCVGEGSNIEWMADNRYFAAEIIGNILNLEPRKWLRPRKIDASLNKERARALGTQFQPYNWTVELQEGAE